MRDERDAEAGPVVIHRCSGNTEAELVRALLESYGIPSHLSSDLTHIAYPLTVDGLGEVRVSVPAPLADEARAVIRAHVTASGPHPVETPEDSEDDEGGAGGAPAA